MEGYLIQLPSCAWGNADGKKRPRNAPKPQGKLLYYILGEGYLQGFTSPDDLEPVESFQLTSFHIEVDPIFSVGMVEVFAYTKNRQPRSDRSKSRRGSDDSSDDEDDEEDDNRSRSSTATSQDSHDAPERSMLLFAGDKTAVEVWATKILNWNRYVFGGGSSEPSPESLAQAKHDLVTAFHAQNNRGMFSTYCELIDGTTSPEPTSLQSAASPTSCSVEQPTSTLSEFCDVVKPGEATTSGSDKPWWMMPNRSASRRISAVSLRK